jgi:molecular chaperone GrpE
MKRDKTGGLHNKKEEVEEKKNDIASSEVSQKETCSLISYEEQLKKKKEEYDNLWDKYLRLCADFDNARKRWVREKEEVVKYASFSLLQELLVVLDEMEQGLKMAREHSNIKEISKGLELMLNNFINILDKRGVKKIEAEGKEFDPHLHEIIGSKEVEGNIEKPIVLEEIQKGYFFENKILRIAKVIVGVSKQAQKEEGREEKSIEEKDEEPT